MRIAYKAGIRDSSGVWHSAAAGMRGFFGPAGIFLSHDEVVIKPSAPGVTGFRQNREDPARKLYAPDFLKSL